MSMKVLTLILLFSSSIIICGCNASITRKGYVLPEVQTNLLPCKNIAIQSYSRFSPDEAVSIGEITASDTGVSLYCSEEEIISIFRKDACAMGANIVNIIEETRPNFLSTCYRATAELLKITNPALLAEIKSDSRYSPERVRERSIITHTRNTGALGTVGGAAGGVAVGVVGGVAGGVAGVAVGASIDSDVSTTNKIPATAP